MTFDKDPAERPLPSPGPPFHIGERVAFFPAVIGPTSNWLQLDYAVIDDIDEPAESFGFHFVGEPGVHHAQGLENVVRPSVNYDAWRFAWEAAFARTSDESAAHAETKELWLRVLAEHPIHGSDVDRHPALPGTKG